jgi:hypothetical protein
LEWRRFRQVTEFLLQAISAFLVARPQVLPEKGEHCLAVADVAAGRVVVELAGAEKESVMFGVRGEPARLASPFSIK